MISKISNTVLTVIWSIVGLYGLYHLFFHNQIDPSLVLAFVGLGFTINIFLINQVADSVNNRLDGINQRFEDHITISHRK